MTIYYNKPGRALARIMDPKVIARFMKKVVITQEGRWMWVGGQNGNGYGYFKLYGRPHLAHRVAFAIEVAAIPTGVTVHHLREPDGTENRLDVTPSRLVLLSHSDNSKDGSRSRWGCTPSTEMYRPPDDVAPF